MHSAALRLEIRIPDARSLKDKRRTLKGLMAFLAGTFQVAVSEVGFQDQWQRSTIGVALVAPQAGHLELVINSVQRAVLGFDGVELLEVGVAYMEEP
jgi:uncharacterized protein YlxP (DUF503 family)